METAGERFVTLRNAFERALSRLTATLARDEDDVVRDAVIRRFAFTFELAWRALFRLLRDRCGPGRPVDVLAAAYRSRLIDDLELWEQVRKYRDETNLTYDDSKAMEVAAFVRSSAMRAFEALRAAMREP